MNDLNNRVLKLEKEMKKILEEIDALKAMVLSNNFSTNKQNQKRMIFYKAGNSSKEE